MKTERKQGIEPGVFSGGSGGVRQGLAAMPNVRRQAIPRLEVLEDRTVPATVYEVYSWHLINQMRADPAGFAVALEALRTGSGAAFGFAPNGPERTDFVAFLSNGANPGNYQQALNLLRATPAKAPLSWDLLLESGAENHNEWMKAYGYAHTLSTRNPPIAVPGYSPTYNPVPDSFHNPNNTFGAWGENISYGFNAAFHSATAFRNGKLTTAQAEARVAFFETIGFITEVNSNTLGHLRNLLDLDYAFNTIGIDLDLYQSPYEVMDSLNESALATQRMANRLNPDFSSKHYAVGLAFRDGNGNGTFDPGEELDASVQWNGGSAQFAAATYHGMVNVLLQPNTTYSFFVGGRLTATFTTGATVTANRAVNLLASPQADGIASFGGTWRLDLKGNGVYDPTAFPAFDPNFPGWNGDDQTTRFGQAGDLPVLGDWTGDGFDGLGVFRNGSWWFDVNHNGVLDGADTTAFYGQAGDRPVAGDWNGLGRDTLGVFRNGAWYLDRNGNGVWDAGADGVVVFGQAGDIPVVGDWTGTGRHQIGVVRNVGGTYFWYLDLDGNGTWSAGDQVRIFGIAGDDPVVGDWNADGRDDVGVKRGTAWYLDANGTGGWDGGDVGYGSFGEAGDRALAGKLRPFAFDTTARPLIGSRVQIGVVRSGVAYLDASANGIWDGTDQIIGIGYPTDIQVFGDWNKIGRPSVGAFRNGTWYLDFNGNGLWDGGDVVRSFGQAGDIPVVGDWNGDGRDDLGVFRGGVWYLDFNGSGGWDAGDRGYAFGVPGDVPVVGDWNGDGRDEIGVFRAGVWYLDFNGSGTWNAGDIGAVFGLSTDIPVVGDWDGDGDDDLGLFRDGTWYLDRNGDRNITGIDLVFSFGTALDRPLVGKRNWLG